MNIVMLTTFYPPYSFGGDAIGMQRLVHALIAMGHKITVIHDIDAYENLADRQVEAPAAIDNLQVIGMSCRFGLLSNLLTHQFSYPIMHQRKIKKMMESEHFDLIWYHNVSLIGGLGLLSFGNAPKIYEAHEHWLVCPTHVLWRHGRELCDKRECFRCGLHHRRPPQLWRQNALMNSYLDEVDVFIAKSEFSKEKHREFGFVQDMQVVPYFLPPKPVASDVAVALEKTHTMSPHPRPYFLFVGRLEKIKGLDDVIPVFANYPDADLVIVGDGDYTAELQQQAAELDNVIFKGRLGPDQLPQYYKHAIALIVPSVCFETFGIILIESFREGTPVIARDLGPFPEIVHRAKGGLLFSDTGTLLEAMSTLQQEPEFRDRMALAAKHGFENWWSEKIVIKSYIRVMDLAVRTYRERVTNAV